MCNVEVLISAMNQNDSSIFKRTNVQSDALMINQCDNENYWEEPHDYGLLKIFSTKERGLSNSRNMALKNVSKKYALLCDDDELLYDGYSQIIENAFEANSKADIVCFQVKRAGKKYSSKGCKLNFLTVSKIASWQISFKVDSVKNAGVIFDANFGAGTPLGSGEEGIFLHDCLKKNLRIYYVPVCIGEVAQKTSTWFKGFDYQYFLNRGKINRRSLGFFWGVLSCVYFVLTKYRRYKNETCFVHACKNIFKGFFG